MVAEVLGFGAVGMGTELRLNREISGDYKERRRIDILFGSFHFITCF